LSFNRFHHQFLEREREREKGVGFGDFHHRGAKIKVKAFCILRPGVAAAQRLNSIAQVL
jgi:hypothetical protein